MRIEALLSHTYCDASQPAIFVMQSEHALSGKIVFSIAESLRAWPYLFLAQWTKIPEALTADVRADHSTIGQPR
jgi:hypothetical protein